MDRAALCIISHFRDETRFRSDLSSKVFSVGWELSDIYTKEIATVHAYTYMGVHLAAHKRQ